VKLPRLKLAAVEDASEAAAYLASKHPAAASAFKQALRRALEEIERSPRRFSRLETNDTEREIRRAILWRFHYLVIYEIVGDSPSVLAVAHASREPDSWRSRLPQN
jgi:plasmid stabilization system protein ParE